MLWQLYEINSHVEFCGFLVERDNGEPNPGELPPVCSRTCGPGELPSASRSCNLGERPASRTCGPHPGKLPPGPVALTMENIHLPPGPVALTMENQTQGASSCLWASTEETPDLSPTPGFLQSPSGQPGSGQWASYLWRRRLDLSDRMAGLWSDRDVGLHVKDDWG